MTRIEKLIIEVDKLYKAGNSNSDPWIFWGYPNHVLVVKNNTEKIAKKENANIEYCVAGALLHDIADVEMDRFDNGHEKRSLQLAHDLLRKTGFEQDEIDSIINDVIIPHPCNEIMPTNLEGKILATADAMSHFQTDFYTFFCWQHWGREKSYDDFKKWVLVKIEKDFNKKIFFDYVKEKIEPDYLALKNIFSK